MHISCLSGENNSNKTKFWLFSILSCLVLNHSVWWLPTEWQGHHSGWLWWLTFPFVLDFPRAVPVRDTSSFTCFNLPKPKSEGNTLSSFYQVNQVKKSFLCAETFKKLKFYHNYKILHGNCIFHLVLKHIFIKYLILKYTHHLSMLQYSSLGLEFTPGKSQNLVST